jgi:hypothetical protein
VCCEGQVCSTPGRVSTDLVTQCPPHRRLTAGPRVAPDPQLTRVAVSTGSAFPTTRPNLNDMTFALRIAALGEHTCLPVDDDRARAIREAVSSLVHALAIEEKYTLVLENFEEWERELLNSALSRSLFMSEDWSEHITELNRLNRRLANLLSLCRLYTDQVRHDLSTLFGRRSQIALSFNTASTRERSARLGFRVMEEIRNHMQHRSLPIHVVGYRLQRRDIAGRNLLESTVAAVLLPKQLREDRDFDTSILAELEALGERVELAPLVREYIAGLAGIHGNLRTLLMPIKEQWDCTVADSVSDFAAQGATNLVGLALVNEATRGTYEVIAYVSTDLTRRRKWLEGRSKYVHQYASALITNRPLGD